MIISYLQSDFGVLERQKQVIHLNLKLRYLDLLQKLAQISMQKVIYALLALCLLQSAYSACADGTYTNPSIAEAGKGECITCLPFCVTCASSTTCITGIDKIKGLDRSASPHTFLCSGASWSAGTFGYNKQKDLCQNCMEGCASCVVDYNVCSACRAGWDFDRAGLQCLRATLGLAAVVLALSVLTLLVGVLTCICACKL